MTKAVADAANTSNPIPFDPEVISFLPAARWLIHLIASRNFNPSVENLGAGVKRIGIKGTVCPTCGQERR